MRGLRGVRELERLTSGPGTSATTEYRLSAPDRLAWRTGGGVTGVVIGTRQWVKAPGVRLARGRLRLRARVPHAQLVHAGARTAARCGCCASASGRAELALMDEGTPVWFRLTVDTATRARAATSG